MSSVLSELVQASETGTTALREALARVVAEEIEVLHEPPDPNDGVYPSATLLQVLAQRAELFVKLMPDYAETRQITADGDEITIALRFTGTLPDGTPVAVDGTDTLLVRDEKVVRLTGRFDSEQMRPLLQALGVA
ncbi:nuclear transport factor 2 family protein [Kineosporia succinea]|uniref:Ketosteroid isomerase-like protein n=1 Tax=Kineosporia succinea TaxID=84632 RepID=A0ABT9P5Y1_9ACTN|nr:nuclear transport factor 2 family protein [Kineosporia succinea]MDP9828101.1 ketosteroid isomerase-like protein [Kineosporia succinea]